MSHAAYLLVGEPFLQSEAVARIRDEVATDSFSEDSFDASSDVQEIITALETPSLFGGRRLIVVHDAERLLKAQNQALEGYLRAPSQGSALVLLSTRSTSLAEAVRACGVVIALEPPRGRDLVGWVRERSRARSLRIDDRAVQTLIDGLGTDLRELDSALEQLATRHEAGAVISAEQVRSTFGRHAEERVWALTDAVSERKPAESLIALRRLLEQGDDPVFVLGALAAQVRRLLVAKRHADGGPQAVASALGLRGYPAQKLHKQAGIYREEELTSALQILAATDLDLKTGELPGVEGAEMALERAVVRLLAPA
ncbi:MAG: DNA polymerase III subunit delta [Actinomycetota bacterium]|nr:DNA polymerase III subunit delta [Actinomycetota bacterium]